MEYTDHGTTAIKKYSFNELEKGRAFDLGKTVLSEEDIIDFAKRHDPLEFHLNQEAAEKSIFKGLVASGPHIFTRVHKEEWIPRFGHTVLAGLEVNNWKFLKPVYANQPIKARTVILGLKANPEKKHAAIRWLYEFRNERDELVQVLETVVLHKID